MPSVAAEVTKIDGEEDAAAPELVAEAPQHEPADRPREVPDRERREGDHQRDERILAGEEGAADLRAKMPKMTKS
jgi:hypothetical protein